MTCPKCKSENTEFSHTFAMDPVYKCNDCGEEYYPHIVIMSEVLNQAKNWVPLEPEKTICPKCGHEFAIYTKR